MDVMMAEDLPTAHDIRFHHEFAIDHKIDRERILQLWAQEFDIDLTGSGFIAVDDGGCTFAHLDGAHPRTGYILETKGLRQTAYGGCVLLEELDVGAAETEQTDLLGAGSSIGIRHIDRSVGLEGFGEVTARRTTEFFGIDLLRVEGFGSALYLAFLTLDDGDFLDLEITRLLRKNDCGKRQKQYCQKLFQ